MFEIVNNRQVIFGENKISEIPGLLNGTGAGRYFLPPTAAARTVT